MLLLDRVHVERPDGTPCCRRVNVTTSVELIGLTQTQNLAQCIARYPERHGLLEGVRKCYLAGDRLEAGQKEQLWGSQITYRIAVGPQHGRKVVKDRTPPAGEESSGEGVDMGFSLTPGVAA